MDLKKGLTYVSFGILFILADFYLSIGNFQINIFPDFIGWILLYLAFDKFGEYTEEYSFLKFVPLVLCVVSFLTWIIGIINPELARSSFISITRYVSSFIELLYIFVICSVTERIGNDYGYKHIIALNILKIIYVLCTIVLISFIIVFDHNDQDWIILTIIALGLIIAILAFIYVIMIFSLRKHVIKRIEG